MNTSKAHQMLEEIRAGHTLFSHTATGWTVVGPADVITAGATVTVIKASGATSQVVIDDTGDTYTADGVSYRAATFHNAPTARRTATRRPATRRHYTRRDHEDCLTFGCCGPTCEYGATLGCTKHNH